MAFSYVPLFLILQTLFSSTCNKHRLFCDVTSFLPLKICLNCITFNLHGSIYMKVALHDLQCCKYSYNFIV
jgi:hypothetical protein